MAIDCPGCEALIEPVSAPVVSADGYGGPQTISTADLRSWDGPSFETEMPLTDVVFFCPICREVLHSRKPDTSWVWVDWSAIPVVVPM